MREIQEKIERAAHDNRPVFIEGESGTGKEVIGRFIHEHGLGKDGPFLKLHCAAASTRVLEEEIFGLEMAGAAIERKGGSGGPVSGGTLFLDGIEGMDNSLQRNLAYALASASRRRIGARKEKSMDARLVCASSLDPKLGLIANELLACFVHRVRLLPLRERKEDIPQLCNYLLCKFARDFGRPVPDLSARAIEALQQWNWPGNIRELENWIARIVIFGAEDVVGPEFRRQLAVGETQGAGYHRAAYMRIGRGRRFPGIGRFCDIGDPLQGNFAKVTRK